MNEIPVYKKSLGVGTIHGKKRSTFDANTAADLNKLQKQIGDNLDVVEPSDLSTLVTDFGDGTNEGTNVKLNITDYFEYLKSKIISQAITVTITAYADGDPSGKVTNVTAANHGLSTGQHIRITGIAGGTTGFHFVKKVIDVDIFSIIYDIGDGTFLVGPPTVEVKKDKILEHGAQLLPAGLIVMIAGTGGIGGEPDNIAGLSDCPAGYVQCEAATIVDLNSIFNTRNIRDVPGLFVRISPDTSQLGDSTVSNSHTHEFDHIHGFPHDHTHNHHDSHDHGQKHFHNDIDTHTHNYGSHTHKISGFSEDIDDNAAGTGNLPGSNIFDSPTIGGRQHIHTYGNKELFTMIPSTNDTGEPFTINHIGQSAILGTVVPTGDNTAKRTEIFEGDTTDNTAADPVPIDTDNTDKTTTTAANHLPRQRTIIFCMKT